MKKTVLLLVFFLISQHCLAEEIQFSGSIVEESCNIRANNYSACATKISGNTEYALQHSPNHYIRTLTYF